MFAQNVDIIDALTLDVRDEVSYLLEILCCEVQAMMKFNARQKIRGKHYRTEGERLVWKKTEYIKFFDERNIEVRVDVKKIFKRDDKFKYLGSTMTKKIK